MEDREERAERKYTEEVLDEEKEDGQLLEGETVKGEGGVGMQMKMMMKVEKYVR